MPGGGGGQPPGSGGPEGVGCGNGGAGNRPSKSGGTREPSSQKFFSLPEIFGPIYPFFQRDKQKILGIIIKNINKEIFCEFFH